MSHAALGYSNADMLGLDDDDFVSIGDELDDLFSGEDEIIGAAAKKKVKSAVAAIARKMAQVREVDPNAVLVRQQQDTRRRYLDLGVPVTSITTLATEIIEIKPQRVFRAEDFIIPDEVATECEMVSATVGQNSQLVGGSPVPLASYSHLCYRPRGILWDTANPGILIQLGIRNFSAATVVFRATLRGTSTVR